MDVDGVEITIVFAVLHADGWHDIQQGSLRVGEALDGWYRDTHPVTLADADKTVPMFSYLEDKEGARVIVRGPLSSILAVKELVYD